MRIDWSGTRVRLTRHVGRVTTGGTWALSATWGELLPDFDLWLVWAGRGWMNTRGGRVVLRPGVCFWMRPGGLYEAAADPGESLGVTFAHFELVDGEGHVLPYDVPVPEVHHLPDVAYADALTHRVVTLVTGPSSARAAGGTIRHVYRPGRPSPDDHRVAEALLTSFLMDLDALSDRPPPPEGSAPAPGEGARRHHHELVSELITQIQDDPLDVPPVAELARRVGYTPDHFARVFKSVTGQTPRDYVVQVRIDRARQLLVESSLTITQVADALGYRDVYFFSRQFRQKTGRSPSQYRRHG